MKSDGATVTSEEMRIDDLATRAGVTSRTIRDYQARGLLPAPRLEGRTGWYVPEHLHRLMVIADLQDRGFSLAAIKATLDAWANGNDLRGLLDFEHVLLAPWGDPEHQSRAMSITELVERFSFLEDLPGAIRLALDAGLLEAQDDDFLAPAPVILEAAEDLLRMGMDLNDLLDLLGQTQDDVARIAERFVDRVAPPVIAQLETDGVVAALDAVRRLRPIALGAVRAVLDVQLRDAIQSRLQALGINLADGPAAVLRLAEAQAAAHAPDVTPDVTPDRG